ncbi:MAG: hypothetical protein PHS76_01750 [Sphaerochaeta sp.]|nr:hypothetical protein [Sphaerochaeta sp.]
MNINQRSTDYLKKVWNLGKTNPFVKQTLQTFHAAYYEVAKLELRSRGEKVEGIDKKHLDLTLNRIRNREDMAEFGIPALIRILKEYQEFLDISIVEEIQETLVGFRYWLDEPGEITACYFSENHQPLYHSAEYLAGALFPEKIFLSDNRTGAWHREHGRTFLRRWMKWRRQFGFSEWCTNYYAEDMIALLGIFSYAEDTDMRFEAKELIDLLFVELALNTFEGHWIGTHGRTYTEYQIESNFDSIGPICYLYFGCGPIDGHLADCAIMLATYEYICPSLALEIAQDRKPVLINKERIGLNTDEAKFYKVNPDDFNNIMFFWGNQTFDAREVIENSKKVITPSNWMNERINAYAEKYKLYEAAGIPYDPDPDFTALTRANLYTYRTPDYAVSCAQDFRKGKLGYQQQPWGATLGGNAYVFTTHPGSTDFCDRPNQIAGNGILPRCVQHENVVISIYRIPADYIRVLETHAYFPQKEMDEVVEYDRWLFGKKGEAYVALFSLVPAHWKKPDPALYQEVYKGEWKKYYNEDYPYFYHANGHANVWISEFGSRAQNGSFEDFCHRFSSATVTGDTFFVQFSSPTHGSMSFGWDVPLTVNGKKIVIDQYKRFDNPYFQKDFILPSECT